MPFWFGIILIVLMACFCYTSHMDLKKKDIERLIERKKELEDKIAKYGNDYSVKTFIEGEIAEINKDIAIIEKNFENDCFNVLKKKIKKLFENE